MKKFKPFRMKCEVFLCRLGLLVLPAMPRRVILGIARVLGAGAYMFSGKLRRIGLANLEVGFGNRKSAAEKRIILRQSFYTFALVVLDLFWFSKDTAKRISRYVHLDTSYAVLLDNNGVICLSGHLGNWELLAQILVTCGIPLTSVVAPLANPAVDKFFHDVRGAMGQALVSKVGAVRKMFSALKKGEKVALLLDQNTRPSLGGTFVDFFGLRTPISTVVASLAYKTGCPVIISSCIPERNGDYRCTPCRVLTPPENRGENRTVTVKDFTSKIARATEDEIMLNPGAWLWMYKRWKYIAPGCDKSRYPFYAHDISEEDRLAVQSELAEAKGRKGELCFE